MQDLSYERGSGDRFNWDCLNREWIITNGLGGYASGTSLGMNTRKYHGLLIASMNPPVERRLLLCSLDEEIIADEETYHLAAHQYPKTVHPGGYLHLQGFTVEPVPTFRYIARGISIEKQVFMVHGENTTIILYNIHNPLDTQVSLRVFPLVNDRDIHHLTRAEDIRFHQEPAKEGTVLKNGQGTLHLDSNMDFRRESHWYYNLEYPAELSRGYPHMEDNFNPGYFEAEVGKGTSSFFIVAATEDTGISDIKDVRNLLESEIERRGKLVESYDSNNTFLRRLVTAGDSFIVRRRSTGSRSVIAGYHWFADWGRDSMISLPGLTLVTGRFDVARDILSTFAANCREGLIPNMFSDLPGGSPIYNSVDASLWFIHSLGRYYDYTKDLGFVDSVWNTVEEIIRSYRTGTRFGIGMDEDCLIHHGGQLTWMDAIVGDLMITPRAGRACEINALWYNALRYAELMGGSIGKETGELQEIAGTAKDNFEEKFLNEEKGCLYDLISGPGYTGKDASVRPNQVLAVSLPFTMLSRSTERSIMKVVTEELLTPYGLRTLSPYDIRYIGTYRGDLLSRDTAYHNGTVWPWLLGPYITAYLKVNDHSPESRSYARMLLKGLERQLDEAGVGTISEVFDGNPPHRPGGCISQSWSVAEISRVLVEDIPAGK
ncbi:MAG: amylo-alpha-1,6-glucosidase [Methanolobus sp.]|nr:amylo-alpha-1,6-glucosidase [Methanolobus sp.]